MNLLKHKVYRLVFAALLIILGFTVSYGFWPKPLVGVYLTFPRQDTGRHITVHFVTGEEVQNPQIHFGLNGPDEITIVPKMETISDVDRFYYTAEVNDLNPGTDYHFKINGWDEEYKFRTLPDDGSTIRILQGGDMGIEDSVADVTRMGLTYEPHAILIGGDIAYANGRKKNVWKWDKWLQLMTESTITPEGYLVPLIVAIGNHEVQIPSVGAPAKRAPFFFAQFRQAGSSTYFSRNLGSHSRVFILDTAHIYPHLGRQSTWLARAMANSQNLSNRLAMYHIPLYPSNRSYNNPFSMAGRHFWGPIFDRYNLTVAMENHDHTLKRTKPIYEGRPVEAGAKTRGTVYLGDGCWGKNGRPVYDREYLVHAESTQHVWIGELNSQGVYFRAIDKNGLVLDEVRIQN